MDLGFTNDGDLQNGNPGINALGIGQYVVLKFDVAVTHDGTVSDVAAYVEARFIEDLTANPPSLNTVARFQRVGVNGDGSDKLLGATLAIPPVEPPPPVIQVPEPGSLAIFGLGSLLAAGAVRRRRQARV